MFEEILSPRSNFWDKAFPEQYWYQVLCIGQVLCAKVEKFSRFILLQNYHLDLEEPWHQQKKMNKGALAQKNASESYLSTKTDKILYFWSKIVNFDWGVLSS